MKLLNLNQDEVEKLLDGMEKEVLVIKRNSIQMCWYMRGGISYTDIMNMSDAERGLISEIIEENLEVTKKSGMNFF